MFPDPLSSFLIIIILIALYAIFSVVSSVLQKSISRRIAEPDFEILFGKETALKLLGNASLYLLSANLWRMLIVGFIFLLIFNSYQYELFSNILAFSSTIFVAVSLLVVVHIAWSLAYASPEKILCYLSPLLRPLLFIFYPFAFVAQYISSSIGEKFSWDEPSDSEQIVTMEDIAEMVDYSEESEENQQELDMLKGVVNLGESTVEEIMTPRQDVVYLSINSSIDEIISVARDSGFSRIPVIDENLDQISGIIIVKDLVKYLVGEDSLRSITEVMRPVMQVPAYDNLLNLLARFRSEKNHFAVVIDDHGGVDGIVTLEDVLEEIVGEIFDESDEDEDPEAQTTLGGDILVDGGMLVYDLNEEYDMNLPEGEYDTVAGFIIDQFGKLPMQGEIIDYSSKQFIVEELSQNRINRIRIKTIKPLAP